MPIVIAVPPQTPTVLAANTVYALPSVSTQMSWQSAAGSDLQVSNDGVNFTSLGVSAANETKSAFTAAAFVKTATANTTVIAKTAPVVPGVSGGGSGSINITGDVNATGNVNAVNGRFTGYMALGPTGYIPSAGDLVVNRGGTSPGAGAIYFGNTALNYLFFDGTQLQIAPIVSVTNIKGPTAFGPAGTPVPGSTGDICINRGGTSPGSGAIFFGNSAAAHYLFYDGVRFNITDPIAAPNGTESAPAYSFSGATNYGWYFRSNVLECAVGGIGRLQINTSGVTSSGYFGLIGAGFSTVTN